MAVAVAKSAPALSALWMPETHATVQQEGFTPWCQRTSPSLSWHWPHLQIIRKELAAVSRRECQRLMLLVPPQHGKTTQTTHRYPVWSMQRQAGLRCLIAAHTQDYANKLSRAAKLVADNAGVPRAGLDRENEWECANGSSLYAVGVGGPLTGRSVDMAIIDDPVKSREEADSEAFRERVWEWYLDDFSTRLQEGAPVILIMTPWHEDDLHGRILAGPEASRWRVVRMPAIAEDDPERPDPLGRQPGQVLCPERFSLETMNERRTANPEGFESLYQLRPTARGGVFFRKEWLEAVDELPEGNIEWVRYWDLAATTKKTSAYTAGVLMGKAKDRYYIADVVRGRWTPAERNDVILRTAQADAESRGHVRTWFEEQPGAAGVETSDSLVRKLAGYPCRADRVTGSKEERAIPLADGSRQGLVKMIRAPWNNPFVAEWCSFPRGAFKDQIDSTSGAYNKLARGNAVLLI